MKAFTPVLALLPLLHVPLAHALNAVSVTGRMDITDSESWGSDEHASPWKTFDTIFVGAPLPASQPFSWSVGMGGEVRIEILCAATAVGHAGTVKVDCDAKLFEGTSESTDDLDGRASGSVTVRVNKTKDLIIGVNNTDDGGDWASIKLTISNSRATA